MLTYIKKYWIDQEPNTHHIFNNNLSVFTQNIQICRIAYNNVYQSEMQTHIRALAYTHTLINK